jgi:hypothetical protein
MANRQAQHVEQQIKMLVEADGDHRSVCRMRFRYKGLIHYGTAPDGRVAIVGEALAETLTSELGTALYRPPARDRPEIAKTIDFRRLSLQQPHHSGCPNRLPHIQLRW